MISGSCKQPAARSTPSEPRDTAISIFGGRLDFGERVTKKGIWGQKVFRVRKLENAVSRSSEGIGRAADCLYGTEMIIGHH